MSEFDKDGKPLVTIEEREKLASEALRSIFGEEAKIKFVNYGYPTLPRIKIEDVYWNEDLLTVLQRFREKYWVELESDICECEECRKNDKEMGATNILVIELTPRGEFEKEVWKEKPKK